MVQINSKSLRLKALFWELGSHRIKVKDFVWIPFVLGLGASAEAVRFLLNFSFHVASVTVVKKANS